MSKDIHTLFTKYKDNYADWKANETFLMKPNTREEWFRDFYKTMSLFQSIYDSNKGIIEDIEEELRDLTREKAELISDELVNLYLNDINDAEFIIHICEKLVEYFTPLNDYNRLVNLYTMLSNYYFETGNPEGLKRDFDISYTKKGMSFIEHYRELDENARYRIWVLHYNYIVRLTDCDVVNIEEALDCYDAIMAFSEEPDIVLLDKDVKKIHALKAYIKQTMFISIGSINEVSEDVRKRYYKYTKAYFEENAVEIKSLYELPSELYTCHLFNEYMEGKLDYDGVFLELLEFFKYKYQFALKETGADADDVLQAANAIRYLTHLGKYISNKELLGHALEQFANLASTKWVKTNLSLYDRINDMLGKVCLSLLTYDMIGVSKEKSIIQLIVQRDINVYTHSKLTAEIAEVIYREMILRDVTFFEPVKSVPARDWKQLLYYSAMFHDIGKERIMGTVVQRNRPAFPSEKERRKKHVEYSAQALENVDISKQYPEIIRGHHVHFDESNAADYKFERKNTDLNPFIDILALSDFIESSTNPFWDFEKKNKKFIALLNEIKELSGTRFNNRLVEVLLESTTLQSKIEKIVTKERENVIFDIYKNWEKIQLSEDEESMLYESLRKFNEYRQNMDKEAFEPSLNVLKHLAKNSQKEDTKGKALYTIMVYCFVNGRYLEGLTFASETEKALRISKNDELLAQYYLNIGNCELLRDNVEPALSAYLSCYSVCKRTPGCEIYMARCLASIAGIFMEKHHYKKAKEYLELCDLSYLEADEQVRYYCMMGYCDIRLNNLTKVSKSRIKVEEILKDNPELVLFPQYVYLAAMAFAEGDSERQERYLKLAKDVPFLDEDVSYYADEMFLFIELMCSLSRYEEASEIADFYIKICEGNREYSTVLLKLLNLKIEAEAHIKGLYEFMQYEGLLKKAYYDAFTEDARRIENIEKSLVEEIKLHDEHEEALANQEILEESVKKAQSDSEQKSQFLSSMSHEIRTPINAILGLNEMIMRESHEESVLSYANDIQNAGKQLLGIINDVLDYSKIEAGKMEIVPQRYNVSTLITDIKNMLEPKLKEKNLEFRVECDKDMPEVLYGDDLRIKQILLNLLSNAYKYTKEGSVEFKIGFSKKDDVSVNVSFAVKDTGIGLKPEQIEKLANPFERFDLVENRGIEGTGLGMSIVTRLLEQMNSSLTIESEYGKGSVFSFTIEQGVIEWRTVGAFTEGRKQFLRENSSGHCGDKAELKAPKAKILIVDDNAVNLKVAATLLKRTKAQVTCASSGKECLELCRENEYHVIMLDHMMPEMDGIETLQHIKEEGLNKTTPVIALTANVVESADNFYIKSGFDALLTKPIEICKMEEVIASLLPEYLVE